MLGLLFTVVAACGGSDGGGGGGGPVAPPSGISFTATGGAATNSIVLRQSPNSTPNLLRLDVVAQGMTNLYGVAFDVVFPNQVLSLNTVTEGSFLAGANTSLQFEPTPNGRVVVGLTRLGNAPGATGSGVLVTIELASRSAAGAGAIAFERNAAYTPTGSTIGGVVWGAGSVTVTP